MRKGAARVPRTPYDPCPMTRFLAVAALLLCPAALADDANKPVLVEVAPEALPPFAEDDLDRASLRRAIAEELKLPEKPGSPSLGGIAATRSELVATLRALDALLARDDLDGQALGAEVAKQFRCFRSVGRDGAGTVLFTAYHSPCYEASRTRTERLCAAVRKAPPEGTRFTRAEIEGQGKLDGLGLELVWMAKLDAFLLEVQGSGSARLEDGTVVRLQCSRSNGQPYTSLGKELVKDGKLTAAEASIPAIRRFFDAHPELLDEYLWRNASYVFFEETTRAPTGCAGAAVTARRSIATDKRLFPPGALGFVVVEMPVCEGGKVTGWQRRARFVVDQDTGGAIVGPGRVDLYMGDDDAAEAGAGVMKQDGQLFYLLAR